MGLDVTAFNRVVKVNVQKDINGEVVPGPDGADAIDADTGKGVELLHLYDNPDFPGRFAGLDPNVFYSAQGSDSVDVSSCGYGRYSAWRNKLAQLAGYASSNAAWENPDPAGRFIELINFSDCEGAIGPVVSAKLAKDFKDFDEKAKKLMDEVDYERYQNFARGFELAADGGVVIFS